MSHNKRECIAVIISKPERKYQEGLLNGIYKAAFARGMNVAVFATSLLAGMDEYLWGEQEIYELIQYEKFAGVVFALGSFYNNKFTEKLGDKMRELAARNIPVVAVDGEVEGVPSFFNDDSNAVEDLVTHLFEEHEVRDIAYMTGHKGHPHAENSLKAYRDTMEKLHLPVKPGRTYYGNYWYDYAEDFVKQLIESEDGLPQAIICANEYMGIGVYKALHARGIYVPKHIRLACTGNDASVAPYLLMGANDLENVGFEACETIIRAMEGEKPVAGVKYFLCKNTLMKNIGCGCQRVSAYDYSEERGVMVDTDPGYYGECNFYREGMLSKKDYHSLFEAFDEHTRFIKGFRGLYMCMCEGWDDPNVLIQDRRKNPYTEKMQIYYYRREDGSEPEVHIGENITFAREEMFPRLFLDEGEPCSYVFHPLHFLDRNFGYVVLDNGQESRVYDYTFNFWLHDVTNAIEAQCRLQSVNYMFFTDLMTGLYNRNGYNTMFDDIVKQAHRKDKQVLVVNADVNYLKRINDTYGHEEGDVVIQTAASLLKAHRILGATMEKNYRIGGDEFVKIAIGDFTDEQVNAFREELYCDVKRCSDELCKPYSIQMSVGYYFEKVEREEDLEAIISKADRCMYEEKQRLKKTAPV